jgi:hypothetical protein
VPDEFAREVLAWKLGFDLPRDDGRLPMLRRTVDHFFAVVSKVGVPSSDEERQEIRAAGVNAFVELEGLLEDVIVFLAWLLTSDHPKDTVFVYSKEIATTLVGNILGSELTSGSESVRWKAAGNTLGTCLRYLQELAIWLQSLPESDRLPLARPASEIHQLSYEVKIFPFKHTQLWADANPSRLAAFAVVVEQCASVLNSCDLAGTRNGLEHYRESHRFPTHARILKTIEASQQFLDMVDEQRLFPKLYWNGGRSIDPFLQGTRVLIDYRGTEYALHTPQVIKGVTPVEEFNVERPVIIAPGLLFGLPNADLLFWITQPSEYATYWKDYPVRSKRTISTTSDQDPQASATDGI